MKECIKVASINAMRQVVMESRNQSTTELGGIIKLMEELMLQYAPVKY